MPGSLGGRLNPKKGSTGVLIAGMEARIVRDDGTEADVNEVGELWAKGATISAGYWNNENATKETFADGWLRTGDRFWVDEDGHFLYVARFYLPPNGNRLVYTLSFADRTKVCFIANVIDNCVILCLNCSGHPQSIGQPSITGGNRECVVRTSKETSTRRDCGWS